MSAFDKSLDMLSPFEAARLGLMRSWPMEAHTELSASGTNGKALSKGLACRFEIEKSLADGSLQVDDVPKVWNQKMKEYLGVEPKDDAEGVLQDMVSSSNMILA